MMSVVDRCRERLSEKLKQRMTVFTIDLNFTEDGKLWFITVSRAHILQTSEDFIILTVFLQKIVILMSKIVDLKTVITEQDSYGMSLGT